MKATGIVRRIDDLGRVVVPKEIRRTLRIREGDPLEIFTDREGQIILKKYSPIGELSTFAAEYAESLAQATGYIVCITDKEHIISVAGNGRKELQGRLISRQLEEAMELREPVLAASGEKIYKKIAAEQSEQYVWEAVHPILSGGDVVGSVALLTKDEKQKFGEAEKLLVKTAAGFLGRQMEQ